MRRAARTPGTGHRIQIAARVVALVVALAASGAIAQPLQRIERADDLPRFTYPVQGELEAIVRDAQRFDAFAAPMRRDIEQLLATHDIAEAATKRSLLGLLMQLDMLQGHFDDALKRSDQIRALQEKPSDKLLSGISVRAIVAAVKKTGASQGPAYAAEVARNVRAELDKLPWMVVRNDVLRSRTAYETMSEAGSVGRVREVLQPVATRTGALSSDMAPAIVSSRYALVFNLPLKVALAETFASYIAANKIDKPDIWAARDVALPPGRNFTPVNIVVWDSGVDAQVFGERMLRRDGKPALLAFDRHARPSAEPLMPIPAGLRERLPALQSRSKGLADLASNVDSAEANEVRALLANLSPERYKPVFEELRLTSSYQHGTHVAGIAMAGNPYARLGIARIEFGYTMIPDPCPTEELEARATANIQAHVEFFRATGTRVVNMSWGGSPRSYEASMEQCGIGANAQERRMLARRWFEQRRTALTQAMASLPDVLFVASAGNTASDPTFNDTYPAGIELPNLVSVGAVDKAGDEAPFTSYGRTVLLHANGYLVESFVPGGTRVAISGTSMSAPQVTNLAAKLLAVRPSMKPQELIALMRSTADRSEDGRRTLVHPAKALAAVGYVAGR